jgi:hypothetical protein
MKIRGVEPKSEFNEVQCWGENPNAQMLCVELRDGSINLYQYAWLQRVQFVPAEDADSVTLFFNQQVVRISGKKLKELVSALQRMAIEWVKEQDERFNSLRTPDGAWVDKIHIVEGPSKSVPKTKEPL